MRLRANSNFKLVPGFEGNLRGSTEQAVLRGRSVLKFEVTVGPQVASFARLVAGQIPGGGRIAGPHGARDHLVVGCRCTGCVTTRPALSSLCGSASSRRASAARGIGQSARGEAYRLSRRPGPLAPVCLVWFYSEFSAQVLNVVYF